MIEVVFLSALALVWICFAVVQDLKTREIANWLNFSLIIFALGFRFFYSLFAGNNFNFFYQGLIGLGIFFILGNIFYYGKLFAGGDAKLLIALGAILPLTESLTINLKIFIATLLIFFVVGAIYTFITSLAIGLKHRKKVSKEFKHQFKLNRKHVLFSLVSAIIFAILSFITIQGIIYFAILIFMLPYVYIYAKAVDESCMVKKIRASELREGDWLYQNVKIGKKLVTANWEGLSQKDIALLKKKHKEVKIRYGVPFSPVFLFSFVILLLTYKWILIWNFFI